ncbi:MAG: hypothetical protein JXB49_21740 [Bacteroidales bacterium]|nr:hypothetical protein [Bacteroidales bacterium]
MDVKKAKMVSRILLWSLVILGAALVVFLFFFIVPLERRNPTNWFNFGVILWLVILNTVVFNILLNQAKHHAKALPALLTFGSIVFIYSIVSILILLSTFADMKYKFLVSAQLIDLFLLLSASVIAFLTVKTAHSVEQQQEATRGGVDDIKRIFEALSLKVVKLPAACNEIKKQFQNIKDDFRYISPNNSADALSYDNTIKSILDHLKSETEKIKDEPEEGQIQTISNLLNDLHDNIKLRKKVYAS